MVGLIEEALNIEINEYGHLSRNREAYNSTSQIVNADNNTTWPNQSV